MENISINGISYRVVGHGENQFMRAVVGPDGIGRVLIRDTLDGPWRLWIGH